MWQRLPFFLVHWPVEPTLHRTRRLRVALSSTRRGMLSMRRVHSYLPGRDTLAAKGCSHYISAQMAQSRTCKRFKVQVTTSWILPPLLRFRSGASIQGSSRLSEFPLLTSGGTVGSAYLVPPSNQSMKPTAPFRCNLSVSATTPCRDLSLSR